VIESNAAALPERDLVAPRIELPTHWYNVLADIPVEVPRDLAPPSGSAIGLAANVPVQLVRESTSRARDIPIPQPVRDAYARWRPTPLWRATQLERHLDTPAQIYVKYEGGNVSGSHKLNSAIPQAYYYAKAGVRRVTTGTGAGQWGTALAAASEMFGLDCSVYMVAVSYQQKPQRRVMMEMLGAQLQASPSELTPTGRRFRKSGQIAGNLALAIAEALDDAGTEDDARFCIGSGETYAILHQSVIGLEAREQMDALGVYPDVVIACTGAGSNFGGTTFPFLRDRFSGERAVRAVSVEPASCPKLTRGTYAYDYTDYSGVTALQKMYTLGHEFTTPDIHAGGLRYHATSKVISALYDADWIEAVAYPQVDVFRSAALFCRLEGVLAAPEAAHALHGVIQEALRAREEGTRPVLLACISGHGYFDMSAYEAFQSNRLHDPQLDEDQIAAGRASLPAVD
jgi:tryptophan synthase beta chain